MQAYGSSSLPAQETRLENLEFTVRQLQAVRGFSLISNQREGYAAAFGITPKMELKIVPFYNGIFWNSLSALGRAMKGKSDVSEGVNGYRDISYVPHVAPNTTRRLGDLLTMAVRNGSKKMDVGWLPKPPAAGLHVRRNTTPPSTPPPPQSAHRADTQPV
jgi:hypothetical protein